ncbi:MAG: hypothetical protein V7L26_05495 [Nostoc sp.]|uniref:hypothetical protein n=1 Tax=Nostoc sp. TaxID=1180 RepID=UPI002FF3BC82
MWVLRYKVGWQYCVGFGISWLRQAGGAVLGWVERLRSVPQGGETQQYQPFWMLGFVPQTPLASPFGRGKRSLLKRREVGKPQGRSGSPNYA